MDRKIIKYLIYTLIIIEVVSLFLPQIGEVLLESKKIFFIAPIVYSLLWLYFLEADEKNTFLIFIANVFILLLSFFSSNYHLFFDNLDIILLLNSLPLLLLISYASFRKFCQKKYNHRLKLISPITMTSRGQFIDVLFFIILIVLLFLWSYIILPFLL